jgi:putative transposase
MRVGPTGLVYKKLFHGAAISLAQAFLLAGATHQMALWHADVCHGPSLRVGDRHVPLRIHAICDDASRYIIAIEAASREREVEMLALWVKAIRRHGVPQVLYLDNGSTYSGAALQTACVRLGVTLVHAQPYDPQARGKMERFWRTLRENVLDHLGHQASLHDVQVRLLAFLDTHYHQSPHASLVGKSPAIMLAIYFIRIIQTTLMLAGRVSASPET